MNRSRIRRLIGLTAVSALTIAALGVGPAAAKVPDWAITPVKLPPTVAPGNDAGYSVTVANNGTSTINAARLTVTPAATPNATPTYFSGLTWSQGGPEISCTTSGKLVCELGTLSAGDRLTFIVAYSVPSQIGNKFDVVFHLEAGTGNVGGKNNSRGDKLEVTSSTTVSSSQNFDGGFVIDDFSYATGGNLGRNNRQISQVDVADSLLTVMLEDGITSDPSCDPNVNAACANLVGEWTRLNAPGNSSYIKLTLHIWGNSVPGPVGADDLVLVHVLDDGTIEVIGDSADEICADANSAPASGECIVATKVGNSFKIVAWLLKNGTMRGGF